ncbi:DNA-methyltransferase [Sneathiella chinensis]|uniref:Methyltransferase n=1 Tax=Sneathiella chinensis TaxID=349750 RepID=A0ABQ5TZL8_9PROT|nr:site-specific DNA-methyltransferase [Sneathiella chinensis]GLQ04918.1 methyltransferase [Sneathiella chinensis]
MMNTTHICRVGDAVAELSRLPENSVDLIVADPPYNLGKNYGNNIDLKDRQEYQEFSRNWLQQAHRALKPGGSLYCFMGVKFIARLYILLEEELAMTPQGWITWHYTQGMGRKRGFSPRHEDILWFSKGPDATFNLDDVRVPQKYFRKRNNMAGANPGDVWQFSHVHYCAAERQPHPTQKPEALIERIIAASSDPGDLVVDPFVGSGTTARVARILGRNSTSFDINPDYVAMTEQRLAAPFDGFDSIDPRKERAPKDLPASERVPDPAE